MTEPRRKVDEKRRFVEMGKAANEIREWGCELSEGSEERV